MSVLSPFTAAETASQRRYEDSLAADQAAQVAELLDRVAAVDAKLDAVGERLTAFEDEVRLEVQDALQTYETEMEVIKAFVLGNADAGQAAQLSAGGLLTTGTQHLTGFLIATGDIFLAMQTARAGALPCAGQTLAVSTHRNLFDVIGYRYGMGATAAHFKLPAASDLPSTVPDGYAWCIRL